MVNFGTKLIHFWMKFKKFNELLPNDISINSIGSTLVDRN